VFLIVLCPPVRESPAGRDGGRPDEVDLLVVGEGASGLVASILAGAPEPVSVRVIERAAESVARHLFATEYEVSVGETVLRVERARDRVRILTDRAEYSARCCVFMDRAREMFMPPVAASVATRVSVGQIPEEADGVDVLVVGATEKAVELSWNAVTAGARVVLAADGMDPAGLSPQADAELVRLGESVDTVVLYRCTVDRVDEADGLPMVSFRDEVTPDLQFDHVVFEGDRQRLDASVVDVTSDALKSGLVWFVDNGSEAPREPGSGPPALVAAGVLEMIVPGSGAERTHVLRRRRRRAGLIAELEVEHYNATITSYQRLHSDLWVMRVEPDRRGSPHVPGQYSSLGLGYWEPRVDDALDVDASRQWDSLIRRSYSISSPIYDESGYLSDGTDKEFLEFYISHVKPTAEHVPSLTPRLALKDIGDRLYLGAKPAGRFTTRLVSNPGDAVLFLSTGTGEAPVNAMVVDLLRRGHCGPVVSAVSGRNWKDLGYLGAHERLAAQFRNYEYLPLPTREAGVKRQYIQDALQNGYLAAAFGGEIDSSRTHVFLCGNPGMIGAPTVVDGTTNFPSRVGSVEVLTGLGFLQDRPGKTGNLHIEEYW
jgi:ferredoxin/flavodoxin---NADP+ reductase